MQKEVFIRFAADEETVVALGATEALLSPDEARRWLDDEFVANQCEPLRASGKVLTADKLMAIAESVGPQRFAEDKEFAHGYARAAVSATGGKAVVRVDLTAGRVSY